MYFGRGRRSCIHARQVYIKKQENACSCVGLNVWLHPRNIVHLCNFLLSFRKRLIVGVAVSAALLQYSKFATQKHKFIHT